jgi:CRISPR-associated protein Csx17
MTIAEVATLFSRGRAEIGGRGVLTPSAFAAAVLRRGVDAGIAEFRRFVLARTTSSNTFEPRFEGTFLLERRNLRPSATAIERVLALAERLPQDKKVGRRWRFVGLRGNIEESMLLVAADPNDPGNSCGLLDAVASALDRVDRNAEFRKARIGWEPLPLAWLPMLFADEIPSTEARLALALVSSFPKERPFALYRFGVRMEHRLFVHPVQTPKQWVWRAGSLSRVLSDALSRRILDWEADRSGLEPVRSPMPASWKHVDRWLNGQVDEALLTRWISRLALFDWRFIPRNVRALAIHDSKRTEADGLLCAFGLMQPLFGLRPLLLEQNSGQDLLSRSSGARTPTAAAALSGLLRAGDIAGAVRVATNRYAMAGAPVSRNDVPWSAGHAERLTASVLFPIFDIELAALVERWLRPRRKKETVTHDTSRTAGRKDHAPNGFGG